MTDPQSEFDETRSPPHSIQVQFGSQWGFVLPEVYRFEDQKWIDEFFLNGTLRLSNFAKFSSYKDEARGDKNEGQGLSIGRSGGRDLGVWLREGRNSFVLSCSLAASNSVMKEMKRDSAFVIWNPLGFATEIARQLPGFIGGVSGMCIYRDPPIILRRLDAADIPDGDTIDYNQIAAAAAKLGGAERYLLKRRKYEPQREYRFIWHLDHPAEDYKDVIAPRAKEFCRNLAINELM